jgi:PhzF family phenazine biosynthesis protein
MMARAMRLRLLQLDAFADRLFSGNPAAVCPLPHGLGWLDDATLQAIARENNLSETAFLLPGADREAREAPEARDEQEADYALRWFTPLVEVELCGHATLASAAVVLDVLEPGRASVTFHSKSGPLRVERVERVERVGGDGAGEAGAFRMDFPRWAPTPCDVPPPLADAIVDALGAWPRSVLRSGATLICVFDEQADVVALAPDFGRVRALPFEAVMVTARGDETCDFVSRFFAPAQGIDEDPVTGSAHCSLAPYWGARLKKTRLRARQRSARGGSLVCELRGDRVMLEGRVVPYLDGAIEIPG